MRLPQVPIVLCVALFVFSALQAAAHAQSAPNNPPKAQAPKPEEQISHVTVEVSGGEDDKPVENASVYLKYVDERKVFKDKKIELNVKTNREGAAHIPSAPVGRALIQVVADGWKTYGRWYDINEPKQTFKVHLERPPKWY
jgi:hypothetical protein